LKLSTSAKLPGRFTENPVQSVPDKGIGREALGLRRGDELKLLFPAGDPA
jgi:hypothetical protein